MKRMTAEVGGATVGGKFAMGTSFFGAIVSWLPHVETVLRMGASAVAILCGLYALYSQWSRNKKRKAHDETVNRTDGRGPDCCGVHDDEGD